MKSMMSSLLMIIAGSILFWSCEKDETQTTLKSGIVPALTASATTVVLEQENENDTAVVFNWNAVDYGFKDALKYALQISKKGTGFASASTTEIALTKADLGKAFKVSELNAELNKILTPGVVSEIELRIKSDVGKIYSNVITMTVTPYKVLILYTYPQAINIAGNFQGWSPGTAPQIVSIKNDGNYDAFIDFNDPAPEFKMVKGNDWPAGDFGDAGGGNLSNGGNNIKLTAGAGNYLLQANTNGMTWSSTKITSWGLIGDATPTGWDSDTDLVYDAATKTWKMTIDLLGGKQIKFRANDAWDINLGDTGNDGKPELGVNDNIPIVSDGNYTVTLDISVGGNWIYSIKKN